MFDIRFRRAATDRGHLVVGALDTMLDAVRTGPAVGGLGAVAANLSSVRCGPVQLTQSAHLSPSADVACPVYHMTLGGVEIARVAVGSVRTY